MKNKKFAVLLGTRDIVIKKIDDGEKFDFRRLNPTRIGPHLKSLLVYIPATNKSKNYLNNLKIEIKEDKVFKKILFQKANSYIVIANPVELLEYFEFQKDNYRGLLDIYIYEKNFGKELENRYYEMPKE